MQQTCPQAVFSLIDVQSSCATISQWDLCEYRHSALVGRPWPSAKTLSL